MTVTTPWVMPFTSHLGYRPPDLRPQFAASVDTGELAAHVAYAATIGLSGVLYPWALRRPVTEVQAVARALDAAGLTSSGVLAVPQSGGLGELWSDRSASGRRRVQQLGRAAAGAARLVQSRHVLVLVTGDARDDMQFANAASGVGELAGVIADFGLRVAVEPLVSVPGSLLTSTSRAVQFVEMVGRDDVGIVYDTGHVDEMGEDLLTSLRSVGPYLELVQLADQPGRVEPGAGELPLVEVALALLDLGYAGLVDLEHGWRDESGPGERAGLERLRTFDAAVRVRRPPS